MLKLLKLRKSKKKKFKSRYSHIPELHEIPKQYREKYLQLPEVKEKEREKIRRWIKKQRKTNPNFIIKLRLRIRTRSAVKKYITKGLLPNKVDKQINYKKVCEHLNKTKPDNWQEYHIDHIKPLCSYDLTNPEELKAANHYTNLQWLTPFENMSKGGRY